MVIIVEAEQASHVTFVGTVPAFNITHQTAIIFALQLHIHHVVFLLDIMANEFTLFGTLVKDFQFLHGVVGQVVEHYLVLSLEEVLTVQREIVHLLAVDIDVSVVLEFGTGHLTNQSVEHRTFWQVKGGGIIHQRVTTIGQFYLGTCYDDSSESDFLIDIIVAALLLLHEDARQFKP